ATWCSKVSSAAANADERCKSDESARKTRRAPSVSWGGFVFHSHFNRAFPRPGGTGGLSARGLRATPIARADHGSWADQDQRLVDHSHTSDNSTTSNHALD